MVIGLSLFDHSKSILNNSEKGNGTLSNSYQSLLVAKDCGWLRNDWEDAFLSTDNATFNISRCSFRETRVVFVSDWELLKPVWFQFHECVFDGEIPSLSDSWVLDLGGHRNDINATDPPISCWASPTHRASKSGMAFSSRGSLRPDPYRARRVIHRLVFAFAVLIP
jgi:hypothetical protein